MKSLKLNYIQEQILRVNEYFLYQFMSSLSESNPFQRMIDQIEQKYDPFNMENERFTNQNDTQINEQQSQYDQKLDDIMKDILDNESQADSDIFQDCIPEENEDDEVS